MGVLYLSLQHARRERLQTAILVLCATVSFALPLVTEILFSRYDEALRARGATSPLLLGARGNDLDLTLSSLYFRRAELDPIPQRLLTELESARLDPGGPRAGVAIPLHLRFTARNRPIVGTSPEYYDHRRLVAVDGSRPALLGEVALGAKVARDLGLKAGDHIFSDPIDLYDIKKPASLKMQVSGVFGETGTADDDALFVGVRTAWVLEGAFHGHDDAKEISADLVLDRQGGNTRLSGAMIEYNEVTPENVNSFHFHGDPAELPLTAVLYVPESAKAATIIRARFDARPELRMLRPSEVIDDLLRSVLRIKELLDGLAVLVIACTAALTALVIALGLRLRRRELKTFHHLGAGPGFVALLLGSEIAGILAVAAVAALGISFGILSLLPDLVRTL